MRSYQEIREVLKGMGFREHDFTAGPFERDKPFVYNGDKATEEDILSDISFLDAWTRPMEIVRQSSSKTLKELFPNVGPVLAFMGTGTCFADSLHGKEWEVDLEPGLYKRLELLTNVRNYIKRHKKPNLSKMDFSEFMWKEPLVSLSWRKGGYASGLPTLMATLDGTLVPILDLGSQKPPIMYHHLPGQILDKMFGKPVGNITGEQYLKLLPAIYTGVSQFKFMYTTCVWDESLAGDWDRSKEVLQGFSDMLRLLPQVTVYGAIPCRLRYVGFGRESQGGVLRRIAEPYAGNDNTMLYDGKAWILLLAINGKPVNGRVAVTEEGRFIVSEWCFRETPRQHERYEMFSGAFNKHNLLTWCAGPLLDRFGGDVSLNTGMVDGRAPDMWNPFRMVPIVGATKIKEEVRKAARELVKDATLKVAAATWKERHAKGEITYPFALVMQDRTVFRVVAPWMPPPHWSTPHAPKTMQGFHVDYYVRLDGEGEGPQHLTEDCINLAWYPVSTPLPASILELMFPPMNEEAKAMLPKIPVSEPTPLEVPVPMEEGAIIGVQAPVFNPGPDGLAFPVVTQPLEPVPPEPMEAP